MKEKTVKKFMSFLMGILLTTGAFSVLTLLIMITLNLVLPGQGILSSWKDILGNFFSLLSFLSLFILLGGYLYMSKGLRSVIKLIMITSIVFLVFFISIGTCMNTAY
jgi:hypothetical protein